MKSYREFLGQDLPDWRELLSTASIFFINSNPFFDFPRPVLQKTVPIGGISVNLKWIKEQKLTKDWEEVLEMRKKTVLISFGSLVKSAYMPKKWRFVIRKISPKKYINCANFPETACSM